MIRTSTFYKFIGTEEDAKKYPDPEPIIGKEYLEHEFENILKKLLDDGNQITINHWEAITKTEPIPIHEVLTKNDRIEIWKLWENSHIPLEAIENYVAFGIKP